MIGFSASAAQPCAIGFLREQVVLQLLRQHGVVAADPFEDHGRVLLLLVAVVREDRLQLRVLAGIGALVVPVDRLEFLHQRDDRAVHVAGLVRQFLDGFVVADARHGRSSWQRNTRFEVMLRPVAEARDRLVHYINTVDGLRQPPAAARELRHRPGMMPPSTTVAASSNSSARQSALANGERRRDVEDLVIRDRPGASASSCACATSAASTPRYSR